MFLLLLIYSSYSSSSFNCSFTSAARSPLFSYRPCLTKMIYSGGSFSLISFVSFNPN